MELTNTIAKLYEGGQVEVVYTDSKGGRERAQIKSAKVDGDYLCLEFDYRCIWQEGTGYAPCENKPVRVDLRLASAKDWGDGRLCVNMVIHGEMLMFYPARHHKRVLADGTMLVKD